MRDLTDVPRGKASWADDNPVRAIEQFLRETPTFVSDRPVPPFNESAMPYSLTHWPMAYLKRVR
mgnify:CR=1 FL=1